jgi:hypothetical protein
MEIVLFIVIAILIAVLVYGLISVCVGLAGIAQAILAFSDHLDEEDK